MIVELKFGIHAMIRIDSKFLRINYRISKFFKIFKKEKKYFCSIEFSSNSIPMNKA
jgi:hypothetical protein